MSHSSTGPVVIARNLRKTFDDVVAVDALSLEVAAGEVVGLLGPNGAGKTTTIKMLTTQLPIESGSAEVASFDIATEGDAVRRSIGLAGQAAAVDDKLTARENLDLFARLYHLPRAERMTRVEELIARFRLGNFADQSAGTLSGGQRRRLDIVAALITSPPAIFLDEPTTGLDPRSRAEIWEEIRRLASEGAAIVLTTQYLDEADQLADRIILIDKGSVVAEGAQADLKGQLEQDVLMVRLADPEQLATAKSAAGSADVHASDATTLLISVAGTQESLAILEAMRTAGVNIADFNLKKPTLDDVFLALTDVS